jgi:hypothetical protein
VGIVDDDKKIMNTSICRFVDSHRIRNRKKLGSGIVHTVLPSSAPIPVQRSSCMSFQSKHSAVDWLKMAPHLDGGDHFGAHSQGNVDKEAV